MKSNKLYFFSGGTLQQLRRKKAYAEQRKISQQVFAAEIKRPYGTVATWESKGIPKIEDAVLVAEYYGVPVPEAMPVSTEYVTGKGTDEGMAREPDDVPFISSAASAIIEALNKLIESKDQIIAEKERLILEKERVIELIRRQLDGPADRQ